MKKLYNAFAKGYWSTYLVFLTLFIMSASACVSVYQKKEFLTNQLLLIDQYKKWDALARYTLPTACTSIYETQRKYLVDIVKLQGDYIVKESSASQNPTESINQPFMPKE